MSSITGLKDGRAAQYKADDIGEEASLSSSSRARIAAQNAAARQRTLEDKQDSKQQHFTFSSTDRNVIALMPEWVQRKLPFYATARGAIERHILSLVTALAVRGVPMRALTTALKEVAITAHYERQVVYTSFAGTVKQLKAAQRGEAKGGRVTPRTTLHVSPTSSTPSPLSLSPLSLSHTYSYFVTPNPTRRRRAADHCLLPANAAAAAAAAAAAGAVGALLRARHAVLLAAVARRRLSRL